MRDEIADVLEGENPTQEEVRDYFDHKRVDERVEAIRNIPLRLMGRLFEICRGAPPISADDLVEHGSSVYVGENSIPLLSTFERRFTRVGEKVIGCNLQGLSLVSGPGYFTAKDTAAGEILFDYTDVPDRAPPGWPQVKPNDRAGLLGASRLIYHNLHDFVRRVSTDGGVLIGSATRLGKAMNSYFILVRR